MKCGAVEILAISRWDDDARAAKSMDPASGAHPEPGRLDAAVFFLKSRLLMLRRGWQDRKNPPRRNRQYSGVSHLPVVSSQSALIWNKVTEAEFSLTAGKVQNLRAACARLTGVEIPAGQIFSFWKQLGRTRRSKGFTEGRELRSGCLVPNLGGGLCQISGLIHAAALEAGLHVVEKHTHSRSLPGAALSPERDATVFWNYIDLRLSAPFDWRLECHLTATHLVVSILAASSRNPISAPVKKEIHGTPTRANADGDCLTCGVVSCFRHPSANAHHGAASGHTAWLLEGCWPEFDDWCHLHAHEGDHWLTPLDGKRWKKSNYAWTLPSNAPIHHATFETLRRSWRQRRLPAQGAVRQRFLLEAHRRLAENFARRLDPKARHLVVSQTLLPHLWLGGHLGGRTFDVLMQRWPLSELHARLDVPAWLHPHSETLADFRADLRIVDAENQALAAAARLVTPHREIAAHFGSRAILLDWKMPAPISRTTAPPIRWFFPASVLGRKGIYELAAALKGTNQELLILGGAREGGTDPIAALNHRRVSVSELAGSTALVLPAWIEHEPRLALLALASGIPVIASKACGLPPHPRLIQVDAGDAEALKNALSAAQAGRFE